MPAVYYQLAEAQAAINEFDKATSNLNQALKLNPHYADASMLLAEIQIYNKNYEPAISFPATIDPPTVTIRFRRVFAGQGL